MSDEVVLPVKAPWQSKTILLGVLTAITGALSMLGIVPSLHEWVQGHSDIVVMVLGALGVGLRLITKGKISIE